MSLDPPFDQNDNRNGRVRRYDPSGIERPTERLVSRRKPEHDFVEQVGDDYAGRPGLNPAL
jgi:hypothetical protein